jgi:hypothetical protein
MKNNSEKKRPRNAIGLYIGLQATDKSFRLFHTQEAYSGIPGTVLEYWVRGPNISSAVRKSHQRVPSY